MRKAELYFPVSFIVENGKVTGFHMVGIYSPDHLAVRTKVDRSLAIKLIQFKKVKIEGR